ncbi:MAG: hypothetical protein KAI02_08485 [Gammaproteobacteria bacterium]|nr:hypothetical protein [Gammaproteobacteria bacterium]
MRKKNYSWGLLSTLLLASPFMTANASETGNIVCSTVDIIACVDNVACVKDTATSFDLPEFIIVDKEKKVIRAAYESGHKGTSNVKSMEQQGDHLILQGVENSRGWSISIDTKKGDMSGSLVGEGLSFLIFGNCTAL